MKSYNSVRRRLEAVSYNLESAQYSSAIIPITRRDNLSLHYRLRYVFSQKPEFFSFTRVYILNSSSLCRCSSVTMEVMRYKRISHLKSTDC